MRLLSTTPTATARRSPRAGFVRQPRRRRLAVRRQRPRRSSGRSAEGHDPMPKFEGKLTDEEIRQTVAYVRSCRAARRRARETMSRRHSALPAAGGRPAARDACSRSTSSSRATGPMVADALDGSRTDRHGDVEGRMGRWREDNPAIHRDRRGRRDRRVRAARGRPVQHPVCEGQFRYRIVREEASRDTYRHSERRRRSPSIPSESGGGGARLAAWRSPSSRRSARRSTCRRSPRARSPERLASEMALRLRLHAGGAAGPPRDRFARRPASARSSAACWNGSAGSSSWRPSARSRWTLTKN